MLYMASHLLGNPDGVAEEDWLEAHQFGKESDLDDDAHFDIIQNNQNVIRD